MANFTIELLENIRMFTIMACKFQQCNDHGDCVIENGLPVCKCWLGYVGKRCRKTVNDGLSVPLTLGVLGFIVGFVILAFLLAFVHQKRQARLRKEMDEKEPLRNNGEFYSTPVKMTGKDEPPPV